VERGDRAFGSSRRELNLVFGLSIPLLGGLSILATAGAPAATHTSHPRAHPPEPANIINPANPSPPGLVGPQLFAPVSAEAAVLINAQTPISSLPNPPAQPFAIHAAAPEDRSRALGCLTAAVYYEAGNQGAQGEAAVAQVVLNRVRSPVFPKTVCGVVYQGSNLPTGCQFTFTCDGSLARPPSPAGWRTAQFIAGRALDGYVETSVGEATHYHAVYVVPSWRLTVTKVAQIGLHIFYRWTGRLGAPAAFEGVYAGNEGARSPSGDIVVEAPVAAMAVAADPSADAPEPPAPLRVVARFEPTAPVTAPPIIATLAAGPTMASAASSSPHRRLPMPSDWSQGRE